MAARRENCFDFLRLFAAVTVVVSHSTDHFGDRVAWVVPGSNFWFYDGVPMFFIISGYLVFDSGQRCRDRGRSMWDFGLNRFLRIVPGLSLWIIAVVVLKKATGYYAPNGSLWTIPAECSFYAAVPILLWLIARFGWGPVLPVMVAIAIAGMGLGIGYDLTTAPNFQRTLYTAVPWSMFFLIGILWLRYEDRIPLRSSWAAVALVLYVLVRTIDVFHIEANVGLRALYYAGALPLSYLIFFIGYRGPQFLAKIPRRIGDLSYGSYIWHMFVVDVILHFGWGWPAWSVLPATLVIAALSWWLVEAPALRLKRYSTRWVPAPAGAAPEPAPAQP